MTAVAAVNVKIYFVNGQRKGDLDYSFSSQCSPVGLPSSWTDVLFLCSRGWKKIVSAPHLVYSSVRRKERIRTDDAKLDLFFRITIIYAYCLLTEILLYTV